MARLLPFLVLLLSLTVPCFTRKLRDIAHHVSQSEYDGQFTIIDSEGRERHFRGFNTIVKGPPYLPVTDHFDWRWSLSKEDFQIMFDMGLNVIRLGVMWPGVEPVRNQYNHTYLKLLSSIVDQAGEYGINVVLDMHQDTLSAKTCGEGIPDWAFDGDPDFPFPWPFYQKITPGPDGHPTPEECSHVNSPGELTKSASYAYQSIYSNRDGLRDSFANCWKVVAAHFRHAKNIVGYNLINEPFAGDIWQNPALLVPGVADTFNLQPLYNVVARAIREVDEDTLILFEGVTWDNLWLGFTDVPGGEDYRNRSVLSYHHYYITEHGPNIVKIEPTVQQRLKDSARLKCGLMMTEVGTTTVPLEDRHILDKFKQSVISWCYKRYYGITGDGDTIFLDPNGTMNMPLAYNMSRPYPAAVAGQTVSWKHSTASSGEDHFEFQFILDPSIDSPSVVHFNSVLYFRSGWMFTVSPAEHVLVSLDDLTIRPNECHEATTSDDFPKSPTGGSSFGGGRRLQLMKTREFAGASQLITFTLSGC
eukprot:TRINITY_DN5745_c0_g1_i1.p1 TRINITY_DN5745_c0_g1~~TRINITY_DN5745_c0_g1_i1.p1  ORF type:complete len:531 (-),score=105.03 TRINITY_DN5745_c0_g1_i1:143-1735(-)